MEDKMLEIKDFPGFCDYMISVSESLMQMLANVEGIRMSGVRKEAEQVAIGRSPREIIEVGDIALIRAIALFEQAVLKHVELEKVEQAKKLIGIF